MMKDERKDGDDGIWMNGEYQSAIEPLMDSNCFHADVQEQGHHERNEVFEQLIQEQWVALNKKRRENDH